MTGRPVLLLAGDDAADLPVPESTVGGGRQILLARTGSEAIARVRESRPAVVAFAFDLQDMTGPDLCRMVRSDPATRSTSLLFVTDHGMDEQVDLCMASGCNDIITRPIDDQQLLEKIRTFTTLALRKELRTMTKVELQKGELALIGQSVNISSSGMLLELGRLLSPGACIRVTFYLPDSAAPLSAEATVFRAEFDGPVPRYGVKFEGLLEDERERIDVFVQQMEKREAL
jgi:CheY-like chemotaxis protein